jgi:hypothetical protein
MATRTYIYRLMIADLADIYADGKDHGNLMVADSLFQRGERVHDVVAYRDGYQIHSRDMFGVLNTEFYTHDAEDWFVTDSPAFSAYHLD